MVTNNPTLESDRGVANASAFNELIARVRRIVRAETNAERIGHAVADLLPPYLKLDGLLSSAELEPDPNDYRQRILHVEENGSFSIAALIWLPGQSTSIHDHISWCVVGVYRGAEYETRYQLRGNDADPHLVESGNRVNVAGSVEALVPPGDIHEVANRGDGLAVSLHIYGADLHAVGCSIRRRYNMPVRRELR